MDAGALNFSVWEKLVDTKKVDAAQVFVFWTTPPYVDYNWTVRGDLDKGFVEKIKQAFLSWTARTLNMPLLDSTGRHAMSQWSPRTFFSLSKKLRARAG